MITSQDVTPASQPGEPQIVHTGSISSTVDLDYLSNLAHKVYHPSPTWPITPLSRPPVSAAPSSTC